MIHVWLDHRTEQCIQETLRDATSASMKKEHNWIEIVETNHISHLVYVQYKSTLVYIEHFQMHMPCARSHSILLCLFRNHTIVAMQLYIIKLHKQTMMGVYECLFVRWCGEYDKERKRDRERKSEWDYWIRLVGWVPSDRVVRQKGEEKGKYGIGLGRL